MSNSNWAMGHGRYCPGGGDRAWHLALWAARYLFLLGIPIIVGAGLKKLLDVVQAGMTRGEVNAFAAEMLTSAIVGLFAIWWLLRYLQRSTLGLFIGYRILLGIAPCCCSSPSANAPESPACE